MKTPREVIQAILDLYDDDESRWTQFAYAADVSSKKLRIKDTTGSRVAFLEKHERDVIDGICWCVTGAVKRLTLENNFRFRESVYEQLAFVLPPPKTHKDAFTQCCEYNDAPERTFADIKAWLYRALELCPAGPG